MEESNEELPQEKEAEDEPVNDLVYFPEATGNERLEIL